MPGRQEAAGADERKAEPAGEGGVSKARPPGCCCFHHGREELRACVWVLGRESLICRVLPGSAEQRWGVKGENWRVWIGAGAAGRRGHGQGRARRRTEVPESLPAALPPARSDPAGYCPRCLRVEDWGCFGFPGTHEPSCSPSFLIAHVVYCKRSWVFAAVSAGTNPWRLRLAVGRDQSR